MIPQSLSRVWSKSDESGRAHPLRGSSLVYSNERPTLVIQPSSGLFALDLSGVWRYRELVYFLIWRDLKVRYKQTLLGVVWVVLQPLITMVIFAVIFSYFANMPSDGLPYPLFTYAALLPWTYFSQAVSRCGGGLVGNANLITKVYFPRLIVPVASVLTPVVDFLLSLVVLFALMAWYGVSPTRGIVFVPVFLLIGLATALAVGLWLSPLNVKYRDVAYVIPFLVQMWMYASPVVYPLSIVPARWQSLYALNPMVGVITGFRWALLGGEPPPLSVTLVSVGVLLTLLYGGLLYFRRTERVLADVI